VALTPVKARLVHPVSNPLLKPNGFSVWPHQEAHMRLILSFVFGIGLAAPAIAQTTAPESPKITANRIQRDGEVTRAQGEVTIATDTVVISADEVDLRNSSNELQARGNVRIRLLLQPGTEEQAVRLVDEAYRVAKRVNDTDALDRLLHPIFIETNQYGTSRDKTKSIDLWRTFKIGSLTTDTSDVRVSGDTAVVTGTQTEDAVQMLFMRTYVRTDARWQLATSMQFRDPRGPSRTQQ
jgi:hypothetical protein